MSARTKARRRALDVLFEADAKGVGARPGALRSLAAQRSQEMVAQVTLPAYAAQAVTGVADHLQQIDAAITELARGWTLERMPSVDRAALRLGIWELWFNDEVDPAVTIDEVVSIVAELSTDRSPRFVNGVLDAAARRGPGNPAADPVPHDAAPAGDSPILEDHRGPENPQRP